MNSSPLLVAGGSGAITSMLASLLLYLSHWPLQALTTEQALNISGLLVMAVGGITHLGVNLGAKKKDQTNV